LPSACAWLVPIWPLTIGSGPAARATDPFAAIVAAAHIVKNSRRSRHPMLIIFGSHKVLAGFK
jgi:hypothetical protein